MCRVCRVYLKMNYDAYDKGLVRWDERIRRSAERVNALLAHIRAGAPGTDRRRPHVEFWWFHSKAQFLIDHFRANPCAAETSVHD